MHAFGRKMMKGLYIVRIARQKERVAAAATNLHFSYADPVTTCCRELGILAISPNSLQQVSATVSTHDKCRLTA